MEDVVSDFVARIAPAARPGGPVRRDRACARRAAASTTSKRAPGRALTATIVVVGPHERLAEAADAVEQLTRRRRPRRSSSRTARTPRRRSACSDHAVALEESAARVPEQRRRRAATLRAFRPWSGGAAEILKCSRAWPISPIGWCSMPRSPRTVWARAAGLAEHTAISDLRWARLTRWRALMAHSSTSRRCARRPHRSTGSSSKAPIAFAAQLYARLAVFESRTGARMSRSSCARFRAGRAIRTDRARRRGSVPVASARAERPLRRGVGARRRAHRDVTRRVTRRSAPHHPDW